MDWDEKPRPKRQVTVGEALDTLGIGELEERVGMLEAEIVRTRSEIERKRKHEADAASLFKR